MSISVYELPEKLAVEMIARPEFVAMCVSSWRYGAYATGDAIVHAFNAMKRMDSEAERAYLGWEIVGNVVELTEMAATAWLNRRAPTEFPLHRASNQQIESLWREMRDHGVKLEEVRAFLRLSGPLGFSRTARQTVRIYERVLDRIKLVLLNIATFWTDHATNARWFRHYPAALSPEQAWLIDRASKDQQDEITARMADVADPLEFITHMKDARTFEHTVLRMQDVAAAVQLGDAAIQLVMNWLANSGVDPSQPRHVRHLLPILTRDLSQEERSTLLNDGHYILD